VLALRRKCSARMPDAVRHRSSGISGVPPFPQANVLRPHSGKKPRDHPDLFTAHDPLVQKRQAEMFRVANDAYDIMRKYCELRDNAASAYTLAPAPGRPGLRTRHQQTPATCGSATKTFRVTEAGWLYQGAMPERRTRSVVIFITAVAYPILRCSKRFRAVAPATCVGSSRSAGLAERQAHQRDPRVPRHASPLRAAGVAPWLPFLLPGTDLLAYQRTLQKKLGQYFVRRGFLSREEMEQMVADLNQHNARFPMPPWPTGELREPSFLPAEQRNFTHIGTTMQVISLQSGSNGNCIYVEAGGRKLCSTPESAVPAPRSGSPSTQGYRAVDALIISHNHSDHISSAGVFQRKFGILSM